MKLLLFCRFRVDQCLALKRLPFESAHWIPARHGENGLTTDNSGNSAGTTYNKDTVGTMEMENDITVTLR